jgi:hypothetical protein
MRETDARPGGAVGARLPKLEHSKAENVFLISETPFRSGFVERFPAV